MDDATFDQWSATLLEMRQERQDTIKLHMEEKGPAYASKELIDYLMVSLDQILTQWWEHEKRSWETNPPADTSLALDNLKSELDSVTDLEINATFEDLDTTRQSYPWSESEVNKGRTDIQTFALDLKKNYAIKIDGLLTPPKAPPSAITPPSRPSPVPFRGGSGGAGSSGLGLLIMFLLGLGLGGAASIYFREAARKAEKKVLSEREQLMQEKKDFIADISDLQDTYYQLVHGKIRNLPELDRLMKPIQDDAAAKKSVVEEDFALTRETLLRKIPAGDRLDRSLEKLEAEKAAQLKRIEDSAQRKLEPYLKEKQLHEELLQKK